MKRIYNSQPLSVTTIYRPLTTSLKIMAMGSLPTTQFYYQTAQEWFPDHAKQPVYADNGVQEDGILRLKANYFLQDEDDLIDTKSIIPQIFWYVDDTQITFTDSSKDYYIVGSDLYIKKNFTHLDGVNVRCDVMFTDPRTSTPIVLSDTLVLNAVLKAKDAWQITLLCDRTRKHFPITSEQTIYDFEAEVREGAILRNDDVAWFWDYSLDNGKTYNAITSDCLWYVSGLGTPKLTIDMDYIESVLVRCRIGSTKSAKTPDLPNEATVSMAWRWPALKPEVFCYGGNRIFAENASMRFGFFVHVPKHDDMTEAQKRHWLVTNWIVRRQGSTTNVVDLNKHGMEVDIAQRFLMNNALGKFIPDPQIGLRGVYDVVAFHDGEIIQLSGGDTFAIRT